MAVPSQEHLEDYCDGVNVKIWCAVGPSARHAGHYKKDGPSLSPVNPNKDDWLYRYIDQWMEDNLEAAIVRIETERKFRDEQIAINRLWNRLHADAAPKLGVEFEAPPGFWTTPTRYRRVYDMVRACEIWQEIYI